MDYKNIVKIGHNGIANKYLAARTRSPEQIHLLDDLAGRLTESASILEAGGEPSLETPHSMAPAGRAG